MPNLSMRTERYLDPDAAVVNVTTVRPVLVDHLLGLTGRHTVGMSLTMLRVMMMERAAAGQKTGDNGQYQEKLSHSCTPILRRSLEADRVTCG